jgi:hypothetical protein
MTRLRRLIVVLGLPILVVGGVAVWLFWTRVEVTIEVSGSPVMRLAGSIDADQAHGKIDARLPTTISAKARNVSYTLENVGDSGTMTVRVLIDGKLSDTVTADADHPIVRGTVERGRVAQKAEARQDH